MKAGRLAVTAAPETGKRLYHDSLATDLPVGRDNFGHGKSTLSSVPATFNMTTLLMQSACRMVCDGWRAARHQMPDRLKTPAGHVVFNAWDRCLGTIATGELPERPP